MCLSLSALSCYSPGTLDTLDSKISTAGKTVGGDRKKVEMGGFHFELQYIQGEGTIDTRCLLSESSEGNY